MITQQGRERRKHARFEGHFKVDLLNMGEDPQISPWEVIIPGVALDISRQGMRLKVPYNVAVGSYLSVIAYYKGSESICLCEVVWKRPDVGQTIYGLYIKEWSRMDDRLEKKLATVERTEAPTGSGKSPVTA